MFAYSPASDNDAGFAVVTERFVCLLGAGTSADTARAVFWLLDGVDSRLEDALGALARWEVAERFALVEMLGTGDRSMRIAVRGQVSVGIEGTTATRLSGPGEATWITGEASGVSSLWLSLDEQKPEGDALPLGRGVAPASAVIAASVTQTPVAVATATVVVEALEPGPDDDVDPERWILRLPDGNELDADGTIVIGRKSWERDVDENFIKHVSVPSPKRQISGSHLELAIIDGELVARDLDSTNGTIVLTPEQPPRLLHGGRATSLQTGDILDLGESFQIVVGNRH